MATEPPVRVVNRIGRPSAWTNARRSAGPFPAAALVDCYLREEVRVEDCIHSGIHSGYELFVLGPRKVWQQQQQAEKYLTPKDAATCVSNNPRSIDSWCRNMCGAGACSAEMCVCDGEDGAAGKQQQQQQQQQQQ